MSAILTKIGLPVLLKTVSSALKKISNPIAKTAADALDTKIYTVTASADTGVTIADFSA